MATSTRSRPATSRRPMLEILALALMVIGSVLLTLGILEVGGLFNVGLGLATVWIGSLALLAPDGGRTGDEEAFLREFGDRI